MPLLAADGAILACDKGSMPAELGVIAVNPQIRAVKKLAAEITDCKPNLNVRPFGMCSSMGNPGGADRHRGEQGGAQADALQPEHHDTMVGSERRDHPKGARCPRGLHGVLRNFGGTVEVKDAVQKVVSVT